MRHGEHGLDFYEARGIKGGSPVAKSVASFAPIYDNLADFAGLWRTLAFPKGCCVKS
jgi:hypothetical protein